MRQMLGRENRSELLTDCVWGTKEVENRNPHFFKIWFTVKEPLGELWKQYLRSGVILISTSNMLLCFQEEGMKIVAINSFMR